MLYNIDSMNYRLSPETKRKLGKFSMTVLLYGLVIYTFVMLGRSVWINYQLQKQITLINNQITQIDTKNKDFQNLIVYYNSESFREVQARSKLGLKKPGEVVVDVPVKKIIDYNSQLEKEKQEVTTPEKKVEVSNYRLWWQYLTNKSK